jgi:hypothetical protein
MKVPFVNLTELDGTPTCGMLPPVKPVFGYSFGSFLGQNSFFFRLSWVFSEEKTIPDRTFFLLIPPMTGVYVL